MKAKIVATDKRRIVNMLRTLALVHIEALDHYHDDVEEHRASAASLEVAARMIEEDKFRHAMFDVEPTLDDIPRDLLDALLEEAHR